MLRGFSDRIRDKQVGLLRIAASAPPTFALLPRAVERFGKRNPGTRIVLHTLPAEEIGERILIGDIDLGLTMAEITEPQVRSTVIGRTEIVAVMLADSPLAARPLITPHDLAGETVISYGAHPSAGRLLDRVFHEAGIERVAQIEITLSIAAAPLVAHGLGVAVVDGADALAELRRPGGAPVPAPARDRDRPDQQHRPAAIALHPRVRARPAGGGRRARRGPSPGPGRWPARPGGVAPSVIAAPADPGA